MFFYVGYWRPSWFKPLYDLKRKSSYFNVISVHDLVNNEILHYILGLLCKKLKNQYDNVYFGGHL